MYAVFNTLTRAFDVLLFPFRTLAPVWGVAFLSLLTAFFVLYIYKRLSNQRAIKRLKKRIQGHFLGIYLFRDDISQILASQSKVFSNVLRYMGHSLLPLAVAIIPIILVCIQMQLRYGYSNLRPGEEVLVSIEFMPGVKALASSVEIKTSDGLSVETPPLRIAELNEIDWRLSVDRYGEQKVKFRVGGSEIDKTVSAGRMVRRLYPVKAQSSLWSILIFPGESLINKKSPLRSIRVGYPYAKVSLLGFHLHWSIVYFLLAIIFGIMLKRFFKVEF